MDNAYIAGLRSDYHKAVLNPEDLPAEPLQAFREWFDLVLAEELPEPNAMILSTSFHDKPSSRVVLLKGIEHEGLVFFSNYESRKALELAQNPHAGLLFFWHALERQVRIEGRVKKIAEAESREYFNTRPRLSQAGAIASPQSREITDRQALDARMQELLALPEGAALEKPEQWGGYVLEPDYFEFWQGRPGRVHDRIAYDKQNGDWRKFRLAP